MKSFVSKSLLCSVSVAWMSLVGCNVPQESEESSVEDVTQTSSALAGDVTRVAGDTPCPAGSIPASAEDARANVTASCSQLGEWDIARLAGGGSMSGSGYGCVIFDSDPRSLGHSLCKRPSQFTVETGDGVCPDGSIMPSRGEAEGYVTTICKQLWSTQRARVAGGHSVRRLVWEPYYPEYCVVDYPDGDSLSYTVCTKYSFLKVNGDSPCGAGKTLLTPQEARARQGEVCSKLGEWDIARLEGGGSISGSGYYDPSSSGHVCPIRVWDTRGMGHAVCKSL